MACHECVNEKYVTTSKASRYWETENGWREKRETGQMKGQRLAKVSEKRGKSK